MTIKKASLVREMLCEFTDYQYLKTKCLTIRPECHGRGRSGVGSKLQTDGVQEMKDWAKRCQVLPGHLKSESTPRFYVWFTVLWPQFLSALPMPSLFSNINNAFLPIKYYAS